MDYSAAVTSLLRNSTDTSFWMQGFIESTTTLQRKQRVVGDVVTCEAIVGCTLSPTPGLPAFLILKDTAAARLEAIYTFDKDIEGTGAEIALYSSGAGIPTITQWYLEAKLLNGAWYEVANHYGYGDLNIGNSSGKSVTFAETFSELRLRVEAYSGTPIWGIAVKTLRGREPLRSNATPVGKWTWMQSTSPYEEGFTAVGQSAYKTGLPELYIKAANNLDSNSAPENALDAGNWNPTLLSDDGEVYQTWMELSAKTPIALTGLSFEVIEGEVSQGFILEGSDTSLTTYASNAKWETITEAHLLLANGGSTLDRGITWVGMGYASILGDITTETDDNTALVANKKTGGTVLCTTNSVYPAGSTYNLAKALPRQVKGSDGWASNWPTPTPHISFDFGDGAGRVVSGIFISARDTLTDFRVEGSHDGTSWVVLSTVNCPTNPISKYFTFSNTTSYRFYKFAITAGAGAPGVTYIQLFEKITTPRAYRRYRLTLRHKNTTATTIKVSNVRFFGHATVAQQVDWVIGSLGSGVDLTSPPPLIGTVLAYYDVNVGSSIRDGAAATSSSTVALPNVQVWDDLSGNNRHLVAGVSGGVTIDKTPGSGVEFFLNTANLYWTGTPITLTAKTVICCVAEGYNEVSAGSGAGNIFDIGEGIGSGGATPTTSTLANFGFSEADANGRSVYTNGIYSPGPLLSYYPSRPDATNPRLRLITIVIDGSVQYVYIDGVLLARYYGATTLTAFDSIALGGSRRVIDSAGHSLRAKIHSLAIISVGAADDVAEVVYTAQARLARTSALYRGETGQAKLLSFVDATDPNYLLAPHNPAAFDRPMPRLALRLDKFDGGLIFLDTPKRSASFTLAQGSALEVSRVAWGAEYRLDEDIPLHIVSTLPTFAFELAQAADLQLVAIPTEFSFVITPETELTIVRPTRVWAFEQVSWKFAELEITRPTPKFSFVPRHYFEIDIQAPARVVSFESVEGTHLTLSPPSRGVEYQLRIGNTSELTLTPAEKQYELVGVVASEGVVADGIAEVRTTLPSRVFSFEVGIGSTFAIEIPRPKNLWEFVGRIGVRAELILVRSIPIAPAFVDSIYELTSTELPSAAIALFSGVDGEASWVSPLGNAEALLDLPAGTNTVLVANTKNGAVTTYEGYQYNSYATAWGKKFGANSNGVFELELTTTTDSGVAIGWEFASGKMSLGTDLQKRMSDVYITGELAGDNQVSIKADDEAEYTYPLLNNGISGSQQVRVQIGKGIRGRYISYRIHGTTAATIDTIGIRAAFVQRRL